MIQVVTLKFIQQSSYRSKLYKLDPFSFLAFR
jgi:hypothetical protein